MRARAHRRAMRAHAGRAPRMHNFALNSITVTLHCKSGRGPAVFANGAMRASLPARRPRPSARAPARHNRGAVAIAVLLLRRNYDDGYYVCYYYYSYYVCYYYYYHHYHTTTQEGAVLLLLLLLPLHVPLPLLCYYYYYYYYYSYYYYYYYYYDCYYSRHALSRRPSPAPAPRQLIVDAPAGWGGDYVPLLPLLPHDYDFYYHDYYYSHYYYNCHDDDDDDDLLQLLLRRRRLLLQQRRRRPRPRPRPRPHDLLACWPATLTPAATPTATSP